MDRTARSGASALEFALVLPIIALVFAGTVELGWYIQARTVIVSAAHEGARAAVIATSANGPAAAATHQAQNTVAMANVGLSNVSVDVQTTGTPPVPITVTVTADYDELVGLFPAPAQVTAQHTMLLEQ